ncbi:tyrosine-type recombinase/integrase [Halobaculum sp. MBLA0147]|uniref:tyrosine-type recombinase/integrase n=1 Tax=Halobaculum sp. MBLA0147 TaxID=3079934 RepID=UPI0035268F36
MSDSSPADTKTATQPQAKTWLRPSDVEQLRDACLSSEVPTYLQDRNEALIALLYDTGLRREEASLLDVDYLDLEEGVLRLPSEIQKGANPPAATLKLGKFGADSTRTLKRYLRDRWKDSDALFPSRQSDRLSPRAITRTVKQLAEIGDVRPLVVDGGRGDPTETTPHTLRHSVAYRVIREEGGRLEDVQLRLRHQNLETTDRVYSHLRTR